MITLKSPGQIERMHEAGRLLAACHREVAKMVRPGVTTWQIDHFVEKYLTQHGAKAEQKGYHGYPFATCASVNDEVCHGFPRRKALRSGDIVTVDFVVNLGGWLADSAWSYPVGDITSDAERLLSVTHEALFAGIAQAVPGKRLGDIGHAIQTLVEGWGFSVVREFTGHGIGQAMHEDPMVLHYGTPGRGLVLEEGMVLTIEPMVNVGEYATKMDSNGWTARTVDGSWSAQYEHTIAITKDGPLILTQL